MSFGRRGDRAFRLVGVAIAACCALAVAASCSVIHRPAWARAAAARSVACSLYASPSGSDLTGDGSQASPFRTAQHLVGALAAGRTGCLESGTYRESPGLTFERGGRAGAPITLSSVPGQTATLAGGYVYVPIGSDYVTVENLNINGSRTRQESVQIFGSHDSLVGNDITNGGQHTSCIIMGFAGDTPYPTHTLIEGNVIHRCGNVADGNQDQAIYFSESQDATVTRNIIWGTAGFAIHLYPDSDGNSITHNVIDGNGYGVIFGSAADGGTGSNNNTVDYNIVANSTAGLNASQSWGGVVGGGNVYNHNCDYNGGSGDSGQDVSTPYGFIVSGEVYGNPAFVNRSAHTVAGYELQSGSPCLSVVGHDTAALLAAGRMPTGDTRVATTPGASTPSVLVPIAMTPIPQPPTASAMLRHR